jgi:hydroxypyruvate reductase
MNLIENPLVRPLLENITDPVKRERREKALEILGAALAAVDPAAAIHNALRYDPLSQQLELAGQVYDLRRYQNVYVVGAGKAGWPMASALAEILGERLTRGLVNVKHGHRPPPGYDTGRIELIEASHPVPDEAGVQGASRMVDLLRDLTENDLVLAVISGGGSALLELPVPGVTLADMQMLTSTLLRSGATINQMNTVRKHLSQVKGGQLAKWASPAPLIGLILSDVVGSPLDVIASGPTVPDTSTFSEAWAILESFGLTEAGKTPPAILEYLRAGVAGQIPETPKPGDPLFDRVQNLIVADNRIAGLAAAEKARSLGFNASLLSTFVEGEAREVARVYAALAKEVLTFNAPLARPACLLLGGETTVQVRGNGLGGRNQEMALAAALAIEELPEIMIVPLATDGTDGPTDAAGAIAEGDTIGRAVTLGLDPADYLRRNDAYHFFERTGDLLRTGPTQTNVNDLTMLLIF